LLLLLLLLMMLLLLLLFPFFFFPTSTIGVSVEKFFSGNLRCQCEYVRVHHEINDGTM